MELKMVEAYPLSWPVGRVRSRVAVSSKFDTPTSKAHNLLLGEIQRMGGTHVIVSSNCPLRTDGIMRMDREPVDSGVAVYFTREGKQMVFACDKYDLVRDNILAIAKTIEALRGIERWGSSDMMERAFSGFKALAPPERDWWDVLEVRRDASREIVEMHFKALAKTRHPDNGGSEAAMMELNAARAKALKEVKQ
jgi:hypothetical protein